LQSLVGALEMDKAELKCMNSLLMDKNEKLMERLKKAESTVVDISRIGLKAFEVYKEAEAWLEPEGK
jgi:hypothetical protein